VLKEISEEIKKEGHRPYIAPIGGSMVGADMELPLGAVGYVDALVELKQQFKDIEEDLDYIIHATGYQSIGSQCIGKERCFFKGYFDYFPGYC